MKLIRRIILKILQSDDYYAILQNKWHEKDLHEKINQITIEEGVQLYSDTMIGNGQNDRSKIFIGSNSHIRGTLLVFPFGGEIRIGKNCYVGDLSRIWSAENIFIGNDVLISHNVNIIDTDSHEINAFERSINGREILKHGLPKDKGNVKTAPIIIEDKAWINFNAVILKGVTIGEGAIVAAGAIVTRNVPPFTLVAGNPAKVIRELF